LVFAFYAIKQILKFNDTAKIGTFVNKFQNHINTKWTDSAGGSQSYTYSLTKDVEEVCIDEDSLIFFKPHGTGGKFDYREIEHLDIEEVSCFEVIEGKVEIRIKKDKGEALVSLE
jgi:hypothetical protein